MELLSHEAIRDIITRRFDFSFYKTESIAEWKNFFADSYAIFFRSRQCHISQRSYPIITTEVLDILAEFLKDKKVADIGCGIGYLSYHLLEKGIDVTPVDNRSSHYTDADSPINDKVIKCDYNELDISPYDVFIISWPNYMSDEVEAFVSRLPSGSIVVYQGEGYGGCTGTDEFHEILHHTYSHQDEISDKLNANHVRFDGIHDKWYVLVKD